ncbi:MAG: hypothetical protein LM573_00615 [Thermofilum sp.]|nr:hypothetical protein [Thermofilum sp.]
MKLRGGWRLSSDAYRVPHWQRYLETWCHGLIVVKVNDKYMIADPILRRAIRRI